MRCKNFIGSIFSFFLKAFLEKQNTFSTPGSALPLQQKILCFNNNLIYFAFPVALFFQLCIFALFSGKGG